MSGPIGPLPDAKGPHTGGPEPFGNPREKGGP